MVVKSEVPTTVTGPKYLNVTGPFPYPGEPQADWDARYDAIEDTVPLDYLGHWVWGDSANVGEMNEAVSTVLFNVTGSEHTADQARLEALEIDDVVYFQQAAVTNTVTVGSVTTVDGVTTVTWTAEDEAGAPVAGVRTDVWGTPK